MADTMSLAQHLVQDGYVERNGRILHNPTLHELCLTIARATSYAREGRPLNEEHPLWELYFAYSEWFRDSICTQLKLPLDTSWDNIYSRVGCLVEEAYPTKEDWWRAYQFGEAHRLSDELAPEKFQEFEAIKYRITGRL